MRTEAQREYARNYYHEKTKNNPAEVEKRRKRAREWYHANKARRKFALTQKKYGVTEEQYVEMYTKQEGKCAICLCEAGEHALVVDHCHATEKVRGLLCFDCNRGLGDFKDNTEAIRRAVLYLEA